MSESTQSTVVVIGAGIIGLTTALNLQSLISNSSIQILLVAREWPTSIPGAPPTHSVDYASMWAGAHVRPIPASTPQLKREAAWLKETAVELESQVKNEPTLGVTSCLGVEYLEAPPDDYANQTNETFTSETGLPGYRKYSKEELPKGVVLGYEYQTYCFNAPVYCANLLRKFILGGGKTLQRDLKTEWEAYSLSPDVHLAVNASGTGFGDPKCFPTRGQTVVTDLTSATRTVTRQNRDGTWTFIIPRFFHGGTIMGGTKEPNDYRSEADLQTRQWLLLGGKSIASYATGTNASDLGEVGVIADVVGRRPTRESGMRIEFEERDVKYFSGTSRKGKVVHAYGAGGRGYEISWGVAREVADLAVLGMSETGPSKARL